jgi:hypothetical protein
MTTAAASPETIRGKKIDLTPGVRFTILSPLMKAKPVFDLGE